MRASANDIQHILAARRVIAVRDHPELRGAVEWRVRTGELVAVLPGVYAPVAVAGPDDHPHRSRCGVGPAGRAHPRGCGSGHLLAIAARARSPSAAEQVFHGLLREAGITGWTANKPLQLGEVTVHPDVMFRHLRLVIEIDGRTFHSDPEVFEADRRRQNLLVLHGWAGAAHHVDDDAARARPGDRDGPGGDG